MPLLFVCLYFFISHPETFLFKIIDDIPKEATILGGEATIYGTFNCNPPNDLSQQKIRMILNDNYVDEGNVFAPNSGGCWCPNCYSTVSVPVSQEKFVKYYYLGDLNTIKFITQTVSGKTNNANDNNFLCISKWTFTTFIEIPDIVIYSVVPKAGPASGGTDVTVIGLGFSKGLDTYCAFGRTLVKATYLSENSIVCKSINTLPGQTIFRVGVNLFDQMFYSNLTTTYQTYADVIIDSIEPESASPNSGKKTITVTGNFAETGSYTCMFSSTRWSDTVLVSGILSVDKNKILCVAPKWDREETVRLSVSINGQQFSDPVLFKFVQKRMSGITAVAIVSVCALAILVSMVALIISCWVHHRKKTGDYERIKDGNAHADVSEISMGKRIGKGTMGEVYKGIWRGTSVAVKRINITGMSEDTLRNFERDIRFMQDLRAPNIVQFMSCAFEGDSAYVITEYMPRGSLYSILHNTGVYKKRRASTYTLSVDAITGWPMMVKMLTDAARGMTYLHTCRPPVVHKNLKSLNLLVDEFWGVKVCDYNLSSVSILLSERDSADEEVSRIKLMQRSKNMRNKKIPSRIFASWTLAPWTAPEVLEKYAYSTKSDVYSFGIIMWECLTREDPYSNISLSKLMYSVLNENLRPEIPSHAPAQYAELIRMCWDENPDNRPPFSTIITKLSEMNSDNWSNMPWGREKSMHFSSIESQPSSSRSRSLRLPTSDPSTLSSSILDIPKQ